MTIDKWRSTGSMRLEHAIDRAYFPLLRLQLLHVDSQITPVNGREGGQDTPGTDLQSFGLSLLVGLPQQGRIV